MNVPFCTDVQQWITSLNSVEVPSTPPVILVEHVAGCAHCRAALLLIIADQIQTPLDAAQVTCDQCQDDLAAYIDIEQNEGSAEAAIAYPHVWWHLWTCADCAEAYQMVIAVRDAEATAKLAPLPLTKLVNRLDPRQTRLNLQRITLPRILFTRILVPHTTWGAEEDDQVLHEEEHDDYQINVAMRKTEGQWRVIVTIDPPIDGEVVLTLGAVTFRARLGPDGVASSGPIPAELLTSPVGPDIAITIEPTQP